MALLDVKTRQKYLKYLGFYTGAVDGIEGTKTKDGYLRLQKKYFKRKSDIDGLYGNNTDILLYNAYLVKKNTKNFKLEEFKCKCKGYCTGYPSKIDKETIVYVQELRNKYGSLTITSGLRCKTHNKKVGGVSDSRHLRGKALDIKKPILFSTLSKRKAVMSEFIKKPEARYTYCKGYYMNKSSKGYIEGSSMGSEIHIDVK